MTIKLNAEATQVGPVYICHGAKDHVFKILGAVESPWVTHGVSLILATDESSLIVAAPQYGDYQEFTSEGAEWTLDCPANGTDCDFEFWLRTEFTAEPYKIPMRLGDYRRKILSSRAPIGAPVISDDVSAEVEVGSWYTEKVLGGVKVEWWVDEELDRTELTSNNGVSTFTHAFTDAGWHNIVAKVHNPYNDAELVEQVFAVRVYAQSPWEEATLLVNGEKVLWNTEITLFRGRATDVTVEVAPEIAARLNLGLVDAGGLNIKASPDFGWQDPIAGKFTWTLTPDNGKSGRVKLAFSSNEVELPWEHSSRVISSNLVDEVDKVNVGGVDYPSGDILFFRDESQTVTLTYKAGSPLQGYPLELKGTVLTGQSNLVVTPCGSHTWKVIASTNSGTFKLDLKGKGMTDYPLPVSKVLSRNLADEVDKVKVGGVDYPLDGIVLFREVINTFTLTYKAGSPLQDYPLELKGTVLSGLQSGDLVVTSPGSHTWKVIASTNSGTFRLDLTGKGMTDYPLPVSKVLSRDLRDEVKLARVGVSPYPTAGIVLFRDTPQTITLDYQSGSPVQGYPLELKAIALTGLQERDLVVTLVGPHKWTVTASNNSGTFKLELSGTEFTVKIELPPSKVLSTNLADEADVRIGGLAVPANGNVFFRGSGKVVTLQLKPGSPLAGHPVILRCVVKGDLIAANVRSSPNFGFGQTVYSWTVSGWLKSGAFQLSLIGTGMTTPITVPLSKLLSPLLLQEATPYLDGLPMESGGRFLGGKPAVLTLQYKNGNFLEGVSLALSWTPWNNLVNGDLSSQPRFGNGTTIHKWSITGVQGKAGTFQMKLHSDDGEGELTMPSNELAIRTATLRFVDLSYETDLVLPPGEFIGSALIPMFYGARLTAADGSVVPGVQITFKSNGDVHHAVTNDKGIARSPKHTIYVFPGLYNLTAETTIPTGDVWGELLVRIPKLGI